MKTNTKEKKLFKRVLEILADAKSPKDVRDQLATDIKKHLRLPGVIKHVATAGTLDINVIRSKRNVTVPAEAK